MIHTVVGEIERRNRNRVVKELEIVVETKVEIKVSSLFKIKYF